MKDKYDREIKIKISNDIITYYCEGIQVSYTFPGPSEERVLQTFEGMITNECNILPQELTTSEQKIEDLNIKIAELQQMIKILLKQNGV